MKTLRNFFRGPKPFLRLRRLLIGVTLIWFSSCDQKKPLDWISPEALSKDYAARGLAQLEKWEEAQSMYVDVLESEPDKAQTHSNLGVLMDILKNPDGALQSLQHALKLATDQKDARLMFAVNFNLGSYYGEKKKVGEALQYYQAALDLNPTSKETKTNIELLVQQQQKGGGQGEGENKDPNKDPGQGQGSGNKPQDKDQKDDPKKDPKDGEKEKNDNGKDKDKEDEAKKEQAERKGSPKYKPRPFQGEQLSEGDVKKILGELRNQEQKIRSNFDKKERKDSGHEKDW